MRQSSALFAVAFLVSLLIGIQAVEGVNANPYGFTFPTQTYPPDSVHLTITVTSPKENASYHNGTINVRFDETIDGPSSIDKTLHIVSTYQGDWMNDSKWCPFPQGVDRFKGQYSFLQHDFDITGIPVGSHTLNITAQGNGGFNENNTEYAFMLLKTVSIKFTIASSTQPAETEPPTTTVPPSVPPTIEPSSTSNQSLVSDYWVNPIAFTAIFSLIAIVAVASVSLVYFKRRKPKTAYVQKP